MATSVDWRQFTMLSVIQGDTFEFLVEVDHFFKTLNVTFRMLDVT